MKKEKRKKDIGLPGTIRQEVETMKGEYP